MTLLSMGARKRREEADELGDDVSARRISYHTGDAWHLFHDPCDNGETWHEAMTGIIQVTRAEGADPDSTAPENFDYKCRECGETYPYPA